MQKPIDRLPPLDLLAAFEAAARHLSFTKAGAERFVTQSAMSRQMRALEDELGVALFQRRHRALVLTEAGARLYAVVTGVLVQLRSTVRALRAPSQREVLSLTTTPGLAALWLIPRLPAFTRANPGIDVRLDTTFEVRRLAAEGFDLAIRYGRVGTVEGTPLFGETAMPVCSPHLPRHLRLAQPSDLAAHTLLQLNSNLTGGMPIDWEPWLQAEGLPGLEPAARLTFSAYNDLIAAALAGQGVAMGRRPMVDALLKSRQLVAPFKGSRSTGRCYVLVVDAAARARPAVRAFCDWLVEQAQVPATDAAPLKASRAAARTNARPRMRKHLP